MTEWDDFDSDEDETTFAQGRLDSRTYASRSFQLARTNSADDGSPARFLCKMFDPQSETMVDLELDDWVIRETPAGRYQFKLLVAREPGNVKELWIQRVPAPGSNGSVKNLLNLRQPEATRLIEFLRVLDASLSKATRLCAWMTPFYETYSRTLKDCSASTAGRPSNCATLFRTTPQPAT